jgi:hypothetical protein
MATACGGGALLSEWRASRAVGPSKLQPRTDDATQVTCNRWLQLTERGFDQVNIVSQSTKNIISFLM